MQSCLRVLCQLFFVFKKSNNDIKRRSEQSRSYFKENQKQSLRNRLGISSAIGWSILFCLPLTSLSLWDHFCFMGICEVERIVAERVKGGKAEYFILWQNYCPSENTWDPVEHLPEDLITAFENRYVDPLCADECRERLALLFEKGLKSPLACNETITMRHIVLQAIFPDLPSDLRGSPYLAS